MESAATEKCILRKSKKRVFPESYSGTESKEEEFSSPVNRNGKGKNKMQKQNEVSILLGTNRTTLKEVIELDLEDSDSSHGKHYIDLSSDDHDSEYESPTSQSHIDTIAHHTGTDSSNSIPPFLESVKTTSSTGMTIPSPSLPGLRTCNHKGVKTSFDNPSGSGEITLEKDSGNNDEVSRKYPNFKKFDIVDDYSDHHYTWENSESFQPPRTWSKKIQKEWKILENDLPDTIFVRVYESRMDLLRAVIIGAEGTPYHDGLFFFDVFFPNNYPAVPPKVYYHSRGLRINPNLYKDGKVCLSLLNTWIGYKNENWTPGVSTMLQVLVSIQGLILNSKPYFNEPGLDSSGSNSKYGENQSKLYNERTLIYSLKTMGYTMKNPPKHFEDLVIGHFGERGVGILRICRGYVNGGGGFGKDVEKCMGALVGGFKGIGVENLDEFLPQSRSLGQKIREFFGF